MNRRKHTYHRRPIVMRSPSARHAHHTIDALTAVEELLDRLATGVGYAVDFQCKAFDKRVRDARKALDDAAVLIIQAYPRRKR